MKRWRVIAERCIALAPIESPRPRARVSAERAREIVRRMRERERTCEGHTRMEVGDVGE
jgi:hypothetical protein